MYIIRYVGIEKDYYLYSQGFFKLELDEERNYICRLENGSIKE